MRELPVWNITNQINAASLVFTRARHDTPAGHSRDFNPSCSFSSPLSIYPKQVSPSANTSHWPASPSAPDSSNRSPGRRPAFIQLRWKTNTPFWWGPSDLSDLSWPLCWPHQLTSAGQMTGTFQSIWTSRCNDRASWFTPWPLSSAKSSHTIRRLHVCVCVWSQADHQGHSGAYNPHLMRLRFTGLSGETKHLLQTGKANKSMTLRRKKSLVLLLLFMRKTTGFREVFTIIMQQSYSRKHTRLEKLQP